VGILAAAAQKMEKLQAGFELSGIDEMRNLLECVLKALEQGF